MLRLLLKPQRVFMQDGASSHTAHVTVDWLADHGVKVMQPWPARSTDLNPMEVIWGQLQRAIDQEGPLERSQLKKYVWEKWNAIPQSVIDATVRTFNGKLKACIKKGGATL